LSGGREAFPARLSFVLPFSLSRERIGRARFRRRGATPMIKSFGGKQPQIHPTAYVAETATVIGDVTIGRESSVWFGAVVRGDVFWIKIGDRTNVQDGTVIHVSNGTHPTVLEDEVTVGHNVTLHGCHVERGCLVGMGSIVMDAARIGAQSIVAAGALVSPGTIVPPRSLVLGVPARVKRQLTDEEVTGLEQFWKNYVGYVQQYKAEDAAAAAAAPASS